MTSEALTSVFGRFMLFFPMFFFSCVSTQTVHFTPTYSSPDNKFTEGISFYTLQWNKSEDNQVTVHCKQIIHTEGNLKVQNQYVQDQSSLYLIQLVDHKGRALTDCAIEDPFNDTFEVFSEEGTIQKDSKTTKEKTMTLRISRTESLPESLYIFKINTNKTLQFISIIKC